jgi:hypothetical protein
LPLAAAVASTAIVTAMAAFAEDTMSKQTTLVREPVVEVGALGRIGDEFGG